jgi:hypothetical protein
MRVFVSGLACLLPFAAGSFAQDRPNFSGSYVLAWPKPEIRHGKTQRPSELKVVQHGRVLKASLTERGKTRTSTYYLDGTESKNVAAGGAPSSDKATIKYRTLLIESTVRVPKATLAIEQKWQLSPDSRHLIIQITATATAAAVDGLPMGSWENVYIRSVPKESKTTCRR